MSLAWLKVDVLLGSIGKLAAASLLVGSLGLTGCGDDPVKSSSVSKSCTLNSDCGGGLVCSFGLCHQECAKSTDCPAGQRCVQTDSSNVCQLNDEAQCHFNTDCSDPLICAIDRQCRNQCQGDKDCLEGQTCADNVCAEPQEVTEEGGLKGAVGTGGEGGQGNSSVGGKGGSGGTGAVSTVGGDNGEGGMTTMPTCEPGGDCVPEGMPCQVGTVTCDSGVAQCAVAGPADDGTDCDKNKVCSDGVCTACKAGDTCSPDPDNVCVTGTISCANGPSCDAPTNVKAGTSCGTDQVCSAGACVACKANDVCDPPGQLCKNGKMACANGPVCAPTTSKAAGYACDTDKVCDSSAACVACVQNDACTPSSNACHKGTQDCTTGPNCVDTLLAADDGTACMGNATFNFCSAGACAACLNGNPCIPANPCHKGTLNCGTSPPTCNDSQANATDGIACGDQKSCISGACLNNDRKLSVTSGAIADVAIDAPFATVTVTLLDKDNAAVPGAVVTVVPSAGAYAAATATSPLGKSQITGRVGRAIGAHKFTVSAPGATSIDFTVNAIAPAKNNIFTLVNVNHLSGVPTTPVAGTISKLDQNARAVTAAADGTLYIADVCVVYRLTPQGVLTRIAGDANESCDDTGDNGPGTSAKLYYPSGLALDEVQNFLYIAQTGYPRVRLLDLTSGKIYAFAGKTGASNVAPWGDKGPADAAYVSPAGVGVSPTGDVFISDQSRIRKVDTSLTIDTFLAPGACNAAGPITLTGCGGYSDACSFAWDKAGQLYISGIFCGDGYSTFRGVARVTQDGSGKATGLTHIAGRDGAVPADGGEGGTATSTAFNYAPGLAFDKAGNLYLSTTGDHRVRRIDSLTDQITTVAGMGPPAGYGGDYVLGNTAQLSSPTTLAFDGANNLYFADFGNAAIRAIWNVGDTTTPTGKLAATTGNGQSVKRDAPFSALTVKVTDGANAVIPGVPINWTRLETGSGLTSAGLASTTQTTGPQGTSAMTGRVGLANGDYHFTASYNDIHGTPVTGSPQTFTVTSTDPTAGHIFPIVNYPHVAGTPVVGPAVFSKLASGSQYGAGIAAASDGTIYISDDCSVYKITNRGELTRFAGTGSCTTASGDSGPATGATLYGPRSLALDEAHGVLYIADYYNSRIRMVTLADNKIFTFAGGGSVSTTPWGEGGPPTSANIGNPASVTVGPDGKVYFPDTSHYMIWVVDPLAADVKIQTFVAPKYPVACAAGTVSLYYSNAEASVAFDSSGAPYIAGYLCPGVNTTPGYGIVKYDPAGKTMTRIAGLSGGSVADPAAAISAAIPDIGGFIFDADDNIVLSQASDDRIRFIDMTSGNISTIAGNGTAGYFVAGDLNADPGAYEAASGVEVSNPNQLALWSNGSILLADRGNYCARMIW